MTAPFSSPEARAILEERLGRPSLPVPSAADFATGMAFVTETFVNDPATSRKWIATHLQSAVHHAAMAEMQKRQAAEHHQAIQAHRASRRAA